MLQSKAPSWQERKSETEAGARLQAARSLAARVEGEEGGAGQEGMRCGAGQAPGWGGGRGGKRLLRCEVRGEVWKRMFNAGVDVLMSAEGGAWEWASPEALEA